MTSKASQSRGASNRLVEGLGRGLRTLCRQAERRWDKVRRENQRASVTRGIKTDEIDFIEPDLRYFLPSSSTSKSRCYRFPAAPVVPGKQSQVQRQLGTGPNFRMLGHIRKRITRNSNQPEKRSKPSWPAFPNLDKVRVRVAFFDNGYDPKQFAPRPPHINMDLARNFVEGKNAVDGVPLKNYPGFPGSQSHGTGTIGIFGGRPIDLVDASGNVISRARLAARPWPKYSVRVATSVVHLDNLLDEEFRSLKYDRQVQRVPFTMPLPTIAMSSQ